MVNVKKSRSNLSDYPNLKRTALPESFWTSPVAAWRPGTKWHLSGNMCAASTSDCPSGVGPVDASMLDDETKRPASTTIPPPGRWQFKEITDLQ